MKSEFTKKQQATIDKCQGRLKEIMAEEYREMNKLKNSPMVKAFNKAIRQENKIKGYPQGVY